MLEFFNNLLELINRGRLLGLIFTECDTNNLGALALEDLQGPAIGVDTDAIGKQQCAKGGSV